MQRISFEKIYDEFHRVLLKVGFPSERAALCARVFAENMRDGVYSHGLIRFPDFVEKARQGAHFDMCAQPEKSVVSDRWSSGTAISDPGWSMPPSAWIGLLTWRVSTAWDAWL